MLVVMYTVCAKPSDIGIILDHSTSIVDPSRGGYDNWEKSVLGFVVKVIEAFPIGPTLTRLGIVGFSSSAWLEFNFVAYNNSRTMIDAVKAIEIRGGETNIARVTNTITSEKKLIIYTVSQKNAPTLASCSFDNHARSLIIFSQLHQHTFKSDTFLIHSLLLNLFAFKWLR